MYRISRAGPASKRISPALCRSRSLATLALTVALTSSAAAADDWFWNGNQRIDLTVDATAVGVLFDATTDADERVDLLTSTGLIDPQAARAARYAAGHLQIIATRPGAARADVLAATRSLAESGAVLAAGPRLLAGEEPYFVTDEILVRYEADTTSEDIAALEVAHDLTRAGVLSYARNPGVVYRLPHGRSLDAMAITRALFESGRVEFAIPDFSIVRVPLATTNDALFPNQWHLNSTGQGGAVIGADVDALAAWDITRGDPSVIVAVVDTGMELGHPDLVPNLIQGTDVLSNDNNPQAEDGLFGAFPENHATSVAGVTAGRGNNAIGTTGIAQLCRVMPIRFLSEFLFPAPTVQDEADAFNFACANGAAIINNSWGPAQAAALPASTKAAIDNCTQNGRGGLGTLVFFAAGNSSLNADTNGYAAYAGTIAVSASTDQNGFASYSNFGGSIDVCAPSNGGVTSGIWTTDRLGGTGYSNGDYTGNFGGTSSASPLAAGVAALVISANPTLSWTAVRQVLRDTADKINPAVGAYDANGHSDKFGFGKVNAAAAVAAVTANGLEIYGVGVPGQAGPLVIDGNSTPTIGNASFAVTLTGALASAPVYTIIGFGQANLPLLGGTLLVNVSGVSFVIPQSAGLSGTAALPTPLPNDQALIGLSFNAQWLSQDPGAVFGVSMSPGLEVTIQP